MTIGWNIDDRLKEHKQHFNQIKHHVYDVKKHGIVLNKRYICCTIVISYLFFTQLNRGIIVTVFIHEKESYKYVEVVVKLVKEKERDIYI